MEVGDGRAEDVAGIMEGQLDVRCNIGHAAVVERDGMLDICLDLRRGVGDFPVFLVDHVKVIELEHGREVPCRGR